MRWPVLSGTKDAQDVDIARGTTVIRIRIDTINDRVAFNDTLPRTRNLALRPHYRVVPKLANCRGNTLSALLCDPSGARLMKPSAHVRDIGDRRDGILDPSRHVARSTTMRRRHRQLVGCVPGIDPSFDFFGGHGPSLANLLKRFLHGGLPLGHRLRPLVFLLGAGRRAHQIKEKFAKLELMWPWERIDIPSRRGYFVSRLMRVDRKVPTGIRVHFGRP